MKTTRILIALALASCADITPIEDRAQYGPVFTIQDWFTTSYFLPYSNGVVLFDAGFRPSNLEDALSDYGVSHAEVTHIFLTHGHGDHLGGLELFPDATVLGLRAERDLVEEETEGQFTIEQCVNDGELFHFDDVDVEVVAAPGHTHGTVSYTHLTLPTKA